MASLSVDFFQWTLKNPVMVASGPLSDSARAIKRLLAAGFGAVVTKTIAPRPSVPVRNAVCSLDGGLLNQELFSTRSLDSWKEDLPGLDGLPVIVSVTAETPGELSDLIRALEKCGGRAFELVLSCPNGRSQSTPETIGSFARAARESTDAPVIAKLSANTNSQFMVELAGAVEESGVDAISMSDSLPALGIDTQTGRIRLNGPAGLSGPAIRPLSLKSIYDIKKAGITCPILGIGGITDFQHVLEYLMVGALAVQVFTALFQRGEGLAQEFTKGLERELAARGLTLDGIRGCAINQVPT